MCDWVQDEQQVVPASTLEQDDDGSMDGGEGGELFSAYLSVYLPACCLSEFCGIHC